MSRFFLFEEQDGGCDYSIGCGFRLREIKGVSSMEQAASAVARDPDEDDDGNPRINTNGDNAIHSARVLRVEDIHEIDIEAIAARRTKKWRDQQTAAEKDRERREYERLKKEFGE